jgi:hypothetical protein
LRDGPAEPAPLPPNFIMINPRLCRGTISFDISGMPRLWPGGKELLDKKHRPIEFWISNCGFRIFCFFYFNPHSAIYIPQFQRPARSMNGSCLMVFAQKLLAPGPGTKSRATFRWRPFQSARGRVSSTLSGSLFFIPPALTGSHDSSEDSGGSPLRLLDEIQICPPGKI